MPKPKRQKEITSLRDLMLDPANANKHTPRGVQMLERSIEQCGVGRPVVATSDGVIIAGNQTVETMVEKGLDNDPIIIRTRGDRAIVHIREDLVSGDEKAVRLGILDNRVNEVSLNWDPEVLTEFQAQDIDLGDMFDPKEFDKITMELPGAAEGRDVSFRAGNSKQCRCPDCGSCFNPKDHPVQG